MKLWNKEVLPDSKAARERILEWAYSADDPYRVNGAKVCARASLRYSYYQQLSDDEMFVVLALHALGALEEVYEREYKRSVLDTNITVQP